MRGITPIISVTILLLITISIAGASWSFVSNYQSLMTSKVVSVIHVSGNITIIKNIGTRAIIKTDITLTAEGKNIDFEMNPEKINPGENAHISYSKNNPKRLKLFTTAFGIDMFCDICEIIYEPKSIGIVSYSKNTVEIRNIGNTTIEADELEVFVDDKKSCIVNPKTIRAGESISMDFASQDFLTENGTEFNVSVRLQNASINYTTTIPAPTVQCPDANNDEIINIFDLAIVGLYYGGACESESEGPAPECPECMATMYGAQFNLRQTSEYNLKGDVNGDCKVDIFDLALVGLWYGEKCEIGNIKYNGKYSEKEAFLISDKEWKDILALVPVATWTENDTIMRYPLLIYHEENTSFDADSIIHFFQQYMPSRVTIIGDTPQELDNLLIADPEFGAGLNETQLQRISPNDCLSYWKPFTNLVYVEDNYTMALMASTYASLLNMPLIIMGSGLDNENIFSGRNVILVGNIQCPDLATCNEQYDLKSLQRRYINLTNTDKIILVNYNDLNINYSWNGFIPEKTSNSVYDIFGKHSLSAPVLATAKHELLLIMGSKNWTDIDEYIENKINYLNIEPKYLTIVAAPNAIPVSIPAQNGGIGTAIDKIYATINNTSLSVGRIFGLTISDVSSYVARVLFYQDLPKNKSNLLFIGLAFESYEHDAAVFDTVFDSLGYNASSIIGIPTSTRDDWENKNLILYMNHGGWDSVAGIASWNLPKLTNSFIMVVACLTCAFDEMWRDYADRLFCSRGIRNGAIGYMGAVGPAGYANSWKRLMNIFQNKTIGDSFKGIEEPFILIGDPTIKLDVPYLLPDTKKIFFIGEENKTLEYEIILQRGNFNGTNLYPYEPCLDIGPLNWSVMIIRSRWDPSYINWHEPEMYYKDNEKHVHFCIDAPGGGIDEFADTDPVNITLFKEHPGFTYTFHSVASARNELDIRRAYVSDLFESEFSVNVILKNTANETLSDVELRAYDLLTFNGNSTTTPSFLAGEEKTISVTLPSMAEQYPGIHGLWVEIW